MPRILRPWMKPNKNWILPGVLTAALGGNAYQAIDRNNVNSKLADTEGKLTYVDGRLAYTEGKLTASRQEGALWNDQYNKLQQNYSDNIDDYNGLVDKYDAQSRHLDEVKSERDGTDSLYRDFKSNYDKQSQQLSGVILERDGVDNLYKNAKQNYEIAKAELGILNNNFDAVVAGKIEEVLADELKGKYTSVEEIDEHLTNLYKSIGITNKSAEAKNRNMDLMAELIAQRDESLGQAYASLGDANIELEKCEDLSAMYARNWNSATNERNKFAQDLEVITEGHDFLFGEVTERDNYITRLEQKVAGQNVPALTQNIPATAEPDKSASGFEYVDFKYKVKKGDDLTHIVLRHEYDVKNVDDLVKAVAQESNLNPHLKYKERKVVKIPHYETVIDGDQATHNRVNLEIDMEPGNTLQSFVKNYLANRVNEYTNDNGLNEDTRAVMKFKDVPGNVELADYARYHKGYLPNDDVAVRKSDGIRGDLIKIGQELVIPSIKVKKYSHP